MILNLFFLSAPPSSVSNLTTKENSIAFVTNRQLCLQKKCLVCLNGFSKGSKSCLWYKGEGKVDPSVPAATVSTKV